MKFLRKDIEYEIYKLDTSLTIKEINHILNLKDEVILTLLQNGNTIKDGKLLNFSYTDKESQPHYNRFAPTEDKMITLPPRRKYKVEYLPYAKKKLDRSL